MKTKLSILIILLLQSVITVGNQYKDSIQSHYKRIWTDTIVSPDYYDVEIIFSEYYVEQEGKGTRVRKKSPSVKIRMDSLKSQFSDVLKELNIDVSPELVRITEREGYYSTEEVCFSGTYSITLNTKEEVSFLFEKLLAKFNRSSFVGFVALPKLSNETRNQITDELELKAKKLAENEIQSYADRNNLKVIMVDRTCISIDKNEASRTMTRYRDYKKFELVFYDIEFTHAFYFIGTLKKE